MIDKPSVETLGLFRISIVENQPPGSIAHNRLGKFKIENLVGDLFYVLLEGDDENSLLVGAGQEESVAAFGAFLQLLGAKRGAPR